MNELLIHPNNYSRFNPQNYKPNGGVANAPQTLKFNMGSGNNFIVKNSNIVITQGATNQDN